VQAGGLVVLLVVCGGGLALGYWRTYRTAWKRQEAWQACASRLRGRCENRPGMLEKPGLDMLLTAEIDGIDVQAQVDTYFADGEMTSDTVVQAWFPAAATEPLRVGVNRPAASGYVFEVAGDRVVGRRTGVEDDASSLQAALRAAVAVVLTA
jgi:hypothetical protein